MTYRNLLFRSAGTPVVGRVRLPAVVLTAMLAACGGGSNNATAVLASLPLAAAPPAVSLPPATPNCVLPAEPQSAATFPFLVGAG